METRDRDPRAESLAEAEPEAELETGELRAPELRRTRAAGPLVQVILLGVYVLAGKVGLHLAFLHASASPVWPPTGIAIAAFLVFGVRVWPAIALGAFLVNVTTQGTFLTSAGVALGNTLEGLAAAFLVNRFAGGARAFLRPSYVFRFALLAGILATTLSATIGVTSLALGGFLPAHSFGAVWWTWWLGDLCGALVVTPALVLLAEELRPRWTKDQVVEALLLLGTLLLTAELVFGVLGPAPIHGDSLEFLCLPPLLWAAFRFGPRETACAAVLLSALAIRATLDGSGPFVRPSPNEALLLMQSFLAITTLTTLAVAASVRERRVADRRIQGLNDRLEQLVHERTQALQGANRELSSEVAERRRAEAELKASEARLLEAQRIAHVGSWEWDIAADRVWWSDELYRLLHVDPARFGRSYEAFLALVHPDDRELVDRHVRGSLADHSPLAFECRIVLANGGERMIQSRGQVVLDAEARPRAMLGTAQDITEHKRMAAERDELVREQAARRQAEEANRLKDEFLAVLSHELRTPLSAIVAWASLLKDGGLDAETFERALDTILRNAKIQSQLISDILDVSRIVSGRIALELEAVELRLPVQAALDTLGPNAQARGVALELAVEPLGRPVLGDPARLQQIVWNLVANAIKFCPESSGRVEVRVRHCGDRAELTIQDNGLGIDPEFLPHAFDRFSQADSTTTRKHGGLGLGLAIARHLVELHGGSIAAANRSEGRGAVFTVLLPLCASGMAPERSDPGQSVALPEISLGGSTVLVVDDEADAREAVGALLERWGASVVHASSVEEALAVCERQPPDFVLTDIAMPHEDGYSLLRRLRALPSGHVSGMRIAALTAYASAEDRRRALSAGFDAYLTKPLQPFELARTVLALLHARRR